MAAKKTSAKKPVSAPKPAASKTAATPTPPITTKKPSARVVPKISPLAGTSVDAYAKKLLGWQADALARIRAIISSAAPSATVSIKWAQPVWEENGPFAYFKASKAHVTFGFWRGAELVDPKKLLEGDGERMKHIKIKGADAVSATLLGAWVREAVGLNREKGNPTKR